MTLIAAYALSLGRITKAPAGLPLIFDNACSLVSDMRDQCGMPSARGAAGAATGAAPPVGYTSLHFNAPDEFCT